MMIKLALGTGMRVAELAAVRLQDFNLGNEPSVFVANGKGGRCRTILISKDLRSRMKKYVASIGLDNSDYLLNVNGRKYTTMGLQKQFKRAIEQAGLPESYSIHCLRHTFGTMVYEHDKDLRMVQRLLGHASINTTQIYAGVSKERTYRVVNGFYE